MGTDAADYEPRSLLSPNSICPSEGHRVAMKTREKYIFFLLLRLLNQGVHNTPSVKTTSATWARSGQLLVFRWMWWRSFTLWSLGNNIMHSHSMWLQRFMETSCDGQGRIKTHQVLLWTMATPRGLQALHVVHLQTVVIYLCRVARGWDFFTASLFAQVTHSMGK